MDLQQYSEESIQLTRKLIKTIKRIQQWQLRNHVRPLENERQEQRNIIFHLLKIYKRNLPQEKFQKFFEFVQRKVTISEQPQFGTYHKSKLQLILQELYEI